MIALLREDLSASLVYVFQKKNLDVFCCKRLQMLRVGQRDGSTGEGGAAMTWRVRLERCRRGARKIQILGSIHVCSTLGACVDVFGNGGHDEERGKAESEAENRRGAGTGREGGWRGTGLFYGSSSMQAGDSLNFSSSGTGPPNPGISLSLRLTHTTWK